MSSPAQRRAQQMRSLLGSVGLVHHHAYSAIKVLEEECRHDPSMKTSLNRIVEKDLMKLSDHLTRTEQLLKILNDHYRNYPKPTPAKWEKMIEQEEREQKQNATL